MKKFTNAEIAQMRAEINNGTVYCGIINGMGGYGRIYESDKWIAWQHYGSSAEENTDEDLRWLLETIFADCDTVVPAEYSKYHCDYVPIDQQYARKDMSMSHPNVWGL